MRAVVIAIVVVTALAALGCASPPEQVPRCEFPSGRPCVEGQVCLGPQGGECNYYACIDGDLIGTAIACGPGDIEPGASPPYVCDPAALTPFTTTPPPGPCPLGALHRIEDGAYAGCVPVDQCEPLPCDPRYGGDGCPIAHVCEATTSTCRRP